MGTSNSNQFGSAEQSFPMYSNAQTPQTFPNNPSFKTAQDYFTQRLGMMPQFQFQQPPGLFGRSGTYPQYPRPPQFFPGGTPSISGGNRITGNIMDFWYGPNGQSGGQQTGGMSPIPQPPQYQEINQTGGPSPLPQTPMPTQMQTGGLTPMDSFGNTGDPAGVFTKFSQMPQQMNPAMMNYNNVAGFGYR